MNYRKLELLAGAADTEFDNQATLHVLKNEALGTSIRESRRRASVRGIDGTQTGMSTG